MVICVKWADVIVSHVCSYEDHKDTPGLYLDSCHIQFHYNDHNLFVLKCCLTSDIENLEDAELWEIQHVFFA